jgi:endonuclease YncB( thermonuclease family)
VKISLTTLSLWFLLSLPILGQEMMPFVDGKVISVTDGDSFALKSDGGKVFHVRLHGIAAPEIQQAYGPASRKNLSDKILGKDLRVYFKLTDNLARVLGKVIIDEEDVGLEQLRAGLTWSYHLYMNELSDEDRVAYEQLAAETKKSKVGLWKDASPVSPWAFRTANKINEIDQVVPDKPGQTIAISFVGNSKTKLYMKSDCRASTSIAAAARISFPDEASAKSAGYRLARGCR